MRVMVYNIYEGGKNGFSGVVDTVRAAQPDILVVNEANGFEHDGKVEALEQTGLPNHHLEQCGDGAGYHVAIFSRLPFVEQIQAVRPLARAGILAVVQLPNIGDTALVGTHLSPYSETDRIEEVERILAALDRYDDAAIAGDLNALSPQDGYAKTLPRRLTASQRAKFSVGGVLQVTAVQRILDAGYTDVAVKAGQQKAPTVPTPANTDPDHAPLRLDYVLVLGRLADRIVGYKVVMDETTEQASDHYPIVADFATGA